MSKSFNPFYEILDESYDAKKATGTKYVHAATLRKSFFGKMTTTFHLFFGDTFTPPEHYGLLDYGMLMIPSLLKATLTSYKPTNAYDRGNYALAWLVWGILIAAKGIAATLLTLSVSPFVGIVHLFSTLLSKPYRSAIDNIPVVDKTSKTNAVSTPLKNYLNGYDLDNTNACLEMRLTGNTKNIKLSINKLYDKSNELNQLSTRSKLVAKFDLSKDDNGKPINQADHQAFKALLKINACPSSQLYAQWKQIKQDCQGISHMYKR